MKATAPFQYALSTKAGCECVAHILQSLTDQHSNATVVSIDGIGAYDLISRNSMLEGLLTMEEGDQVLPFVQSFYGSPSTYLWEDEMGDMHEIPQGEGGDQGDPLMPMLFALGQHRALEAVQRSAFLDDVYVVCTPDRVADVLTILAQELQRHAHINLHQGKTQVWNRGGEVREGIEAITRAARAVKPDAIVWRGDMLLPLEEQGTKVLGAPIGHPAFVHKYLEKKSIEQAELLQRILHVQDTQACWLLLLMCAATRANFWLRVVRPEDSFAFAERHDDRVCDCLRAILGTPAAPMSVKVLAHLPLSMGGLGLTSAVQTRVAAHWASWADSISMVRKRHQGIARNPAHVSSL